MGIVSRHRIAKRSESASGAITTKKSLRIPQTSALQDSVHACAVKAVGDAANKSFHVRYSALSAIAGSTRAARRAGNHTPIKATALNSRGTATKTAGSRAVTPNRKLA